MSQNDEAAPPSGSPIGLREETLLEMRRRRHAYAHEVEAIVDELIYLRSKAVDAGDDRADRLLHAARLIDHNMYWANTPQGRAFWKEASDQLVANAKALLDNPNLFEAD